MVEAPVTLSVSNASVIRRGKRLLGPIDLTFAEHGLTMVIGPNGAGKTTLLKSLHGIERLSEGEVTWSLPSEEMRDRQAYVFQRPIMLRRSVRDNLAYPLQVVGTSKSEIRKRCAYWADKIGLVDAMDRPAPRLSGGEQQKLALARALIRNPTVLFLDEPCASLDGQATRDIEALLKQAQAAGTRIIMTTHNIGQLRRLATDVIMLRAGKVCETGSTPQILDTPQSPDLKALLKGDIL